MKTRNKWKDIMQNIRCKQKMSLMMLSPGKIGRANCTPDTKS